MRPNIYFFLLVLLFVKQTITAQNFPSGYNFTLPYNDSTTQLFLPDFPKKAITTADKVTAVGDKFYAAGSPVRFWGVNISASANYPSKANAEAAAGRMRKMGINLVRIHHYDNPWSGANGTIFNTGGTRSINAANQDKLDYFVAQLKANGIYVNLNLNNSRVFTNSDGVLFADSLQEFAKGLTLFDPYLQFLQREHAQQYLSHVNPYTGMSLAQDPVVAMVELNNENTLYGMWKSNQMTTYAKGGILPAYYSRKLDTLFCTFLKGKYVTNTALSAAWSPSGGAASPELLLNQGFETGNINNWALEKYTTAQATLTATNTFAASGTYSGLLDVTQVTGTDWHIQFKQANVTVQKDTTYELVFKARTDGANKTINASVMLDISPFTWYNGSDFTLTTSWQTFKLSFTAPANSSNIRINFNPKQNIGKFYFDDFSFKKPVANGLSAGENLDNCTVKRIAYGERAGFSKQRVADMGEFFIQTQKTHFDSYKNYVKNTLGVTAPISGTNALVGPADVQHSTNLDYTDDHSYWNHPDFPAGFSFTNFSVRNTPLFKDVLVEAITNAMGGLNIANQPYTISEYNHSGPNRYRTEMVHALSAYSAFHDVDGVMFFDYISDNNDWNIDRLNYFFAIGSDHSVMSLFPSCAYAYRKGFMAADASPLNVQYSSKWIYDKTQTDNKGRWEKLFPYDSRLSLTKKIHSTYNQAVENFSATSSFSPSTSYTTSNNQTNIDIAKGVLKTGTDKFIAISGELPTATATNSGVLTLNSATNFGSMTLLASDDKNIADSKNLLLTLSTKMQNTGMAWNGSNTSLTNWGTSPTMNQYQKVNMTLALNADTLFIYPLNTVGKESTKRAIIGVTPAGQRGPNTKNFTFEIDQNTEKTMWFGLRTSSDCAYATINFCAGEKYELEIEDPTLTNIQWFKNNQAISTATSIKYTADALGTYTYTAKNVAGCDVEICCPIILQQSTNCCKPVVCTGVKIVRK